MNGRPRDEARLEAEYGGAAEKLEKPTCALPAKNIRMCHDTPMHMPLLQSNLIDEYQEQPSKRQIVYTYTRAWRI